MAASSFSFPSQEALSAFHPPSSSSSSSSSSRPTFAQWLGPALQPTGTGFLSEHVIGTQQIAQSDTFSKYHSRWSSEAALAFMAQRQMPTEAMTWPYVPTAEQEQVVKDLKAQTSTRALAVTKAERAATKLSKEAIANTEEILRREARDEREQAQAEASGAAPAASPSSSTSDALKATLLARDEAEASAVTAKERLATSKAAEVRAVKRLAVMSAARNCPPLTKPGLQLLEKKHPLNADGVRNMGGMRCTGEDNDGQCEEIVPLGELCPRHLSVAHGLRIGRSTVTKGNGLFATRTFQVGDSIEWYVGDALPAHLVPAKCKYAADAVDPKDKNAPVKWCIDGSRTNAGVSRLINDATGSKFSANVGTYFESNTAVMVFAKEIIHIGQEILMEYGGTYWKRVDPDGKMRAAWNTSQVKVTQPMPSDADDQSAAYMQLLWLCWMKSQHEDYDAPILTFGRAQDSEADSQQGSDQDDPDVVRAPRQTDQKLTKRQRKTLMDKASKAIRDAKKREAERTKQAATAASPAAKVVRTAGEVTHGGAQTKRQRAVAVAVEQGIAFELRLDSAWWALQHENALFVPAEPADLRRQRFADEAARGVRRPGDEADRVQRAVYTGVNDQFSFDGSPRLDAEAETENPPLRNIAIKDVALKSAIGKEYHVVNRFAKPMETVNAGAAQAGTTPKRSALDDVVEIDLTGRTVDSRTSGETDIGDGDDDPVDDDSDDEDEQGFEIVSSGDNNEKAREADIVRAPSTLAAAAAAADRTAAAAQDIIEAQRRVSRSRSKTPPLELTGPQRRRQASLAARVASSGEDHRSATEALAEFNKLRLMESKDRARTHADKMQSDCDAIIGLAFDAYDRDNRALQERIRSTRDQLIENQRSSVETFEELLARADGSREIIVQAQQELEQREYVAQTATLEMRLEETRADEGRRRLSDERNRQVARARAALSLATQQQLFNAAELAHMQVTAGQARQDLMDIKAAEDAAAMARLSTRIAAEGAEAVERAEAALIEVQKRRQVEEDAYQASRSALARQLERERLDAAIDADIAKADKEERASSMRRYRDKQRELDEAQDVEGRRRMMAASGTSTERRSRSRSPIRGQVAGPSAVFATPRRGASTSSMPRTELRQQPGQGDAQREEAVEAAANAAAEYVATGEVQTATSRALQTVPGTELELAIVASMIDPSLSSRAVALAERGFDFEDEALKLVNAGGRVVSQAAMALAQAAATDSAALDRERLATIRLLRSENAEDEDELQGDVAARAMSAMAAEAAQEAAGDMHDIYEDEALESAETGEQLAARQ